MDAPTPFCALIHRAAALRSGLANDYNNPGETWKGGSRSDVGDEH